MTETDKDQQSPLGAARVIDMARGTGMQADDILYGDGNYRSSAAVEKLPEVKAPSLKLGSRQVKALQMIRLARETATPENMIDLIDLKVGSAGAARNVVRSLEARKMVICPSRPTNAARSWISKDYRLTALGEQALKAYEAAVRSAI